MKRLVKSLALAIATSCPAWVVHAAEDAVKVIAFKVHITQNPRGIEHAINDIAKSPLVVEALQQAARVYGVSPDQVAAEAAVTPSLTRAQGSEETFIKVSADTGYALCTARFRIISAAGRGQFGATLRHQRLDIYVWTQKQQLGRGRSWIEADVEIEALRDEVFDQNKSRCVQGSSNPTDRSSVVYMYKW